MKEKECIFKSRPKEEKVCPGITPCDECSKCEVMVFDD